MPDNLEEQTTFMLSEPGQDFPDSSPGLEPVGTDAVMDEAQADEAEANEVEADETEANETEADIGFGDSASDLETAPEFTETGPQIMGDDQVLTPHGRSTQKETRRDVSRRALQALKNQKRVSQHGIAYPALPPAFVKRVASTALQSSGLSNHKISPDTLAALTQASEWYFEQLGDDLGAYANHAKRKTIEESDVATLMRR